MSDVRNHPPAELLEMFERRQGDLGPVEPMPPSIRRRIRTRRTVTAAAVVALSVLAIGVAIKALPGAFDSQPANPTPPAPSLRPTASGHTELFRWQVLAGPGEHGRVATELQISSLAGGDWTTVGERSFDPTGSAFTSSYLEAGQYADHLPSATVVWGFLPRGADRIVLDPGEGCEPIAIDAADAVPARGGNAIWATNVRCSGTGPGTIVAQDPDGAEIETNGYATPIPTDAWAITRSRHGGIGWVLRRVLEQPTGVGIGDGGVPDQIESPVRGDQLSTATVAWAMTPPADDGRFVYGIVRPEVDRVYLVFQDGSRAGTTLTTLPGDSFDVFFADVSETPVQLTAFDADCKVLVNESMDGGPVDPPSGGCKTKG